MNIMIRATFLRLPTLSWLCVSTNVATPTGVVIKLLWFFFKKKWLKPLVFFLVVVSFQCVRHLEEMAENTAKKFIKLEDLTEYKV